MAFDPWPSELSDRKALRKAVHRFHVVVQRTVKKLTSSGRRPQRKKKNTFFLNIPRDPQKKSSETKV